VQEGKRGEGNKREGESCWKSGGGRVRLYTWRRTGLADEVGSDATPDAAGGEGGHGAAKPDAVIHKNVRRRGPKVVAAKRILPYFWCSASSGLFS
jgi:hypothetical protein